MQGAFEVLPERAHEVLKTLIRGHLDTMISTAPGLDDRARERAREELLDDEALEREVGELVQRSSEGDVPIQIGFGAGAPPPRQNN